MGLRPALSIRSPWYWLAGQAVGFNGEEIQSISPNQRLKIGVGGDADSMPGRL